MIGEKEQNIITAIKHGVRPPTEKDNHADLGIGENEKEKDNESRIKKIILENIGNPDSPLVKRLFPENAERITADVFYNALNKLCEAGITTTVRERLQIFRGALEYFNEKEKPKYPIAHATGSDSLRSIIQEKAIREGGTGETGEAAGQSRGGKQSGVSVVEMSHPMADYVELFYGRMAANQELTEKILKINADIIDKKSLAEDFTQICLDYINVDIFLAAIATKSRESIESLKLKIAREFHKQTDKITREDIKKSKIITDALLLSLEEISRRKHYLTAEIAKRDYRAFERIIEMCEECQNGGLPTIEYGGKKYQDPNEIIESAHKFYPLRDRDPVEKKILYELGNEYAYFLRPQENGEQGAPRYTSAELHLKSTEILKEYAEWIKNSSTFKTLSDLYPSKNESENEKIKRLARIKELENQYPVIIIIEGEEYKKMGLTYTKQKGQKPVPFFEAEERIMDNISLSNVREIVVPILKTGEVKKWFNDSGVANEFLPKIVAFEYFEIKRIINHQLEEMGRKADFAN